MGGQRPFGLARGRIRLPEDFNAPDPEIERLFGGMERRLADRDSLAGEYSIADMAAVPWARLEAVIESLHPSTGRVGR